MISQPQTRPDRHQASAGTTRAREIEPREIGLHLLFIAMVLGLPLGLAMTSAAFRDGDVSWQIAAGQWILGHGRIPTIDPFSYTAAGRPWVAMEWLAEIIYAGAFRLAGYGGVAALVAAALMLLHAAIFFYLRRRVSIAILAVSLLMLDLVLAPFVLARPHVLAWAILGIWTITLLRAAEAGRPPRLRWALLLVLWTNMHASFPLALPIAAAIGFDSARAENWTNGRSWLLFGCVSVVALMANANGIAGLLQPFRTASLAMLPFIGEWHASSPNATPYFFGVLLAGLGALLWTGVRIPVGRLVLLLVLLALAFAHVRHQGTFIIVATLIVPTLFTSKSTSADVPRWLLLGAVPMLAYACLSGFTPPESAANPRGLIAAVPPELRAQPVFNEYTFGGPLILAGIKPYIDGRAEIYGDPFVADYAEIIGGDMAAFDRAEQRYGFRWAMLPLGSKALLHGLEASGEWHRLYVDRIGVIEVRMTPGREALEPIR
ncbi:hypothetical protein [Sphingomonas sp.]|uniref:hypothetical protein n=1 Tax=Sphingomonas sp. TaxID=28214 RepID=UPI0025D088B0|nr:hypothetical protein [Sphingomonas sp.]MBV9527431.1 hypothetical protein [Sphingomonas sp.]